ncbi:MAG: HAD hydrolase-like protein [Eubacteriales bacterium]|jgi:phosphoglycolate phosphatase|nr:HAD hydrolase-like protein [Eubacteriales bacterium]
MTVKPDRRYLLFDLDGTLTDPSVGITNSVAYAAARFSITVDDKTRLNKFIGPPLVESFERYFRLTKAEAQKAIAYYREYFVETGIFENFVYPGIPHMLEELKSDGRTLIVATSKPTVFAVRILRHFNLDGYFTFTAGSEPDGRRTDKSEVIAHALNECAIRGLSDAIMTGDREHDIKGAKTAGIASVGVLYGFGDREELTTAGADFIAEDIHMLKNLLLGDR